MSKRQRAAITYDDACGLLETVLAGTAREDILAAAECGRLRSAMRSHSFPTATGTLALQRVVQSLDARTRTEGLHVLESWDYQAQRFAAEIAPVLMLDRHVSPDETGTEHCATLAVLLDQYFLTVLGLCAVRAWDEGDANANLDRVSRLVALLQGPGGSGHRFVDDAETLLLLAISHYHPEEKAYDTLIHKVWTLDDAHQLRVALPCAAALGGHLRWGMRYMYKRDVGAMREDNAVDYPWLLFSAATLMRAHLGNADERREDVVEGLVSAFTADPWAFTGPPPAGMRSHAAEHDAVREGFAQDRERLLDAFEAHRPELRSYSPLGFQCNFLCNAFVAMVATAFGGATAHPSLNGLFTKRRSDGFAPDAVEGYAKLLTGYARSSGAALIVYDPYEAAHSFNLAIGVLRGST